MAVLITKCLVCQSKGKKPEECEIQANGARQLYLATELHFRRLHLTEWESYIEKRSQTQQLIHNATASFRSFINDIVDGTADIFEEI